MKVVILCGGLGTRLREETEFRPKPMVEIGGRPLLWHILKTYAHHGLRDFVLCLGYKGHVIRQYFLDYAAMNQDFTVCPGKPDDIIYHGTVEESDFNVTLAETGAETATGGRLKRVEKYLGETFCVAYGDRVADVNVKALIAYHVMHGKLGTVTVAPHSSRHGVLKLEQDGLVNEFAEKPKLDGAVSIGFFVFNRGVLGYIDGDDCSLEQAPIQGLVAQRQLMAFRHNGFERPCDTYCEYLALNKLWNEGDAPWKTW